MARSRLPQANARAGITPDRGELLWEFPWKTQYDVNSIDPVFVGNEFFLSAYGKAFQTDPTSAFGGIIALNVPLDEAVAQQISKQFVEVLMAPAFTPEALVVFKAKANVRLLQIDLPKGGTSAWDQGRNAVDIKRIGDRKSVV